MSAEENKALIRHWVEDGFNKGNLDVLDEVYSTNFIYHNAFPPPEEVRGLEEIKNIWSIYLNAFPDAKVTIEDQIAKGDKVVTRFIFTGTHKGELIGITPTGNRVTFTGISIHRVAEDKCMEEWENFNTFRFMQQLGAVPPLCEGDNK